MMDFPKEAKNHTDRLEVVYATISQLLAEHEEMRGHIGTDISVAEFKKWERDTWRPMHKHALHLKNQYKRILKLNPKGEEELPEDKKALKDSLKAAARDKDNGKFKGHFSGKRAKDLIAPWNKSMNDMYADLQAEAEAAERE